MQKLLKTIGIFILFLIALITLWWFWPARTPGISQANSNSVSSLEYIQINDQEQCVLIRSHDTDNPILLFLHGGPGMPMMYLAHEFQRPLEINFTVVQWDRRGAGKTFSRNIPPVETMNTRQLVDDAFILFDTLRKRYKQEKIILVGHSFGTYLGSIMVNEKPELFKAYISIGQVVDDNKARILQEKFIRKIAVAKGKEKILAEIDSDRNPNLENWLFEFGGELKNSKSFLPLLWSGLFAPEYTLRDAMNVGKGSSFSSTKMKYNILSGSIFQSIREYDVPVYFLVGRNDFTTPHELVKEYFYLISAPEKELIYFENSAHFPFYEEPDTFNQVMLDILNVDNRK